MSESQALVAAGRPVLEYLPIGLFGSVMGITGLSVAWRLAHARYGVSDWIPLAIAAIAVFVFVLLTAGYLLKLATAFAVVKAEFRTRSRAICSARFSSACCCCRSLWNHTPTASHRVSGSLGRSAW